MTGWDTFAVVSGGGAGALIGLLFVAVSIRVDVIAASRDFSSRAGQTLTLFTTVLLVAVLLAVPWQSGRQLGAELLALAVAVGGVLYLLEREARAHASSEPISRVLAAIGTNVSAPALLGISGVLLLGGWEDGVYVLVPTIVAAIVSGIASAWLLLVHVRS
jgi:hypothetical protein